MVENMSPTEESQPEPESFIQFKGEPVHRKNTLHASCCHDT